MNPTMNAIDVIVSDVDATITFYRHLGLEFAIDPNTPGHASCDLPGGLHLMLDAEDLRVPTLPGWSRPTGGPRTCLTFEFPDPAAVDAKYAELTAAGYRGIKEPWDAWWGMRYATVADPDGNGVDLYAGLSTD